MRFLLLLWLACAAVYGQSRSHSYTATPSAGSVGWFRLLEQSGSNYIDHKAANSLSANGEYIWPFPSAGCIASDGVGVISFVTCGNSLWSRTGTNTYLTNAADFVGINTATPTWQFTVESSDYASGEHFPIGARAADGSVAAVLGYRANGTTGTAGILRSGNSKPLDLGTTGATQAMRIQNDGSISIGTTTDMAELFHVAGGTVIASYLSTYAGIVYYDDDQSNYVILEAPANVTSNFTITLPTANCTAGNFITLTAGVFNCATPSGGSSLPVVDTTSVAKGSSDATKEVRFEVDTNVPTGTVVVLTVPSANAALAGLNLIQTWSASQAFAGISATSISVGAGFSVDASGNTDALSLEIGGVSVLNSSRRWVPSSFLFNTDGSSSIGSASANRPGTIYVGAGTAGGSGVLVYNGTVLRMLVAPPYLSLYNNSSSEVIRLDSNAGDMIFTGALIQTATSRISSAGVFNAASYNVSGTEVISSSRVGKLVSLDINGTTDRINSSGVFNGASFNVSGTEVVSSGRAGKFVSVDVNGTNFVNSSRDVNAYSLTVNGSYGISFSGVTLASSYYVAGTVAVDSSRHTNFANLKFTGQAWWPVTDDNSWTPSGSTTAKLYVYDSAGNGIGWVPIYP